MATESNIWVGFGPESVNVNDHFNHWNLACDQETGVLDKETEAFYLFLLLGSFSLC